MRSLRPFKPAAGKWHPRWIDREAVWIATAVICLLLGGTVAWLDAHGVVPGWSDATGVTTALVTAPAVDDGSPGATWGFARARAFHLMVEGEAILKLERAKRGLPVDTAIDPNRTGLIGEAFSPITSTYGDIIAKRTTTNPQWAALIVDLLWKAGVRPGDAVVAGFSGSFPGLNLAVWSAATAMQLDLLVISSASASTYGANIPGWTWIDMENTLWRAGIILERSLGYTAGGSEDSGKGLAVGGLALLREAALRNGVTLYSFSSLEEAVRWRQRIIEGELEKRRRKPKAYINVGGSQASAGQSGAAWLKPGWNAGRLRTPIGGMAGWALDQGLPLLHLLNVKQLALEHGLPIDPVPLPSQLPAWPRPKPN